jgi:HSP20 family protein
MNLTKYYRNPELTTWPPLTSLRDQLSRMFDLPFSGQPTEAFGDWSPALDAFEDKDKYVVTVEVPGLKKEDIHVSVHDGVLTISGERKSEIDVKEGTVHRTERFYGKFSRSVTLPSAVKSDKVLASYKDGILNVEVPKADEAKPRNIEVKIS